MIFARSVRHILYTGSELLFHRRVLTKSYRSALSLGRLYPKSSLSINSPVEVPNDSNSTFNGFIPIDKLELSFCRSGGPGGQHVNKVNTKVELRFCLETADWLAPELRKTISHMYKSRMNKDGYLIVRCDKTRSQVYNQAEAVSMLRALIRTAAVASQPLPPPSQETLASNRKRQEKANVERLFQKRIHSQKKAERRNSIDL